MAILRRSENVIDSQLNELNEKREEARTAWRKEWRKRSFGYRMSHKNDGSGDYGSLAFLVISLILAAFVFQFIYLPSTSEVGGINYHLSNEISYSCPGGDWNGNTSEMTTAYGTNIYYYCPDDGRLIGIRYYGEPQPIA